MIEHKFIKNIQNIISTYSWIPPTIKNVLAMLYQKCKSTFPVGAW